MITATDIAQIDHKRIYDIYEKWPDHFSAASAIPAKIDHNPDYYNSLILCGMGASATGADILSDLIQSVGNISSLVLKGGSIPRYINKKSLVIVNSVSGNTQESLSMMKEASSRNAEVICISSGGKLKEMAHSNGHQHIQIPNLSVPRASLPYLIMPGVKLIDPFLKKSLKTESSAVYKSLLELRKRMTVNNPEDSNIAKQIANFIQTGFAFCFTSPYLVSAGTRFKDSLNENAKVHCLRESVLEASHNEIVPFTYKNSFEPKVLFLSWAGDQTIIKERFQKVRALFKQIDQPFMEINAFQKSLLTAIVSSIYTLDFATIYAAVSRGIDPSPTPAIDILKKM